MAVLDLMTKAAMHVHFLNLVIMNKGFFMPFLNIGRVG